MMQRRRVIKPLLNSQKKVLREIAAQDGQWSKATTRVGRFVECYIVAEALARRLIAIKLGRQCPQTLSFTSIQSATKSLGLSSNISPELIEQVFRSGELQRSNNTPRQLRNAIIHGLSDKACHEVNEYSVRLMKLMQRWLQHFASI